MSGMTVNVEFTAGTTLKEAIAEAKEKCVKWDVAYVCFTFNGAEFHISSKADTLECYKNIYTYIASLS